MCCRKDKDLRTCNHTHIHVFAHTHTHTHTHTTHNTHSYYTEVKAKRDADLVVMDTDACIFTDDGFR